MRTLLTLAALVVAAVLYVLATSEVRSTPSEVEAVSPASSDDAVASPELAAPEKAVERVVEEVATEGPEVAAFPECPLGFSRIDVRVRDGRRPVANARVRVSEEVDPVFLGEPDEDGICRTDASGRASFHVRALRTMQVTASTDGAVWARSELVTSSFERRSRTIVVRIAGDLDDATFGLLALSFPTGLPLDGAEILVDTKGSGDLDAAGVLRTGVDGRVELPWSEGVRFRVRAEGHSEVVVQAPPRPHGEARTVELSAFARLAGRLDPEHGGARVRLLAPPVWSNDERRILAESLGRSARPAVRTVAESRVAEDGSWAIEEVAFGASREPLEDLRVAVAGGRTQRTLAYGLSLSPGDDLEITDRWMGAPAVTVAVEYESGTAVGSGEPLYVIDGLESPPRIVAEARVVEGKARFPRLPIRSWSYAVRYVDPRKVRIDGVFQHGGTGTANVIVRGFDAIAGKVTGATWSRELVARVTRLSDGQLVSSSSVDRTGAFRCEFVPTSGDVRVEVGASGFHFDSDSRDRSVTFQEIASTITRAGQLDITLDAEGK